MSEQSAHNNALVHEPWTVGVRAVEDWTYTSPIILKSERSVETAFRPEEQMDDSGRPLS